MVFATFQLIGNACSSMLQASLATPVQKIVIPLPECMLQMKLASKRKNCQISTLLPSYSYLRSFSRSTSLSSLGRLRSRFALPGRIEWAST